MARQRQPKPTRPKPTRQEARKARRKTVRRGAGLKLSPGYQPQLDGGRCIVSAFPDRVITLIKDATDSEDPIVFYAVKVDPAGTAKKPKAFERCGDWFQAVKLFASFYRAALQANEGAL